MNTHGRIVWPRMLSISYLHRKCLVSVLQPYKTHAMKFHDCDCCFISDLLYRVRMAAVVLNASSSSPSSSSLTSEEIVKRLRVSITSLKASHMSEDGSQVNKLGTCPVMLLDCSLEWASGNLAVLSVDTLELKNSSNKNGSFQTTFSENIKIVPKMSVLKSRLLK